MTDSYKSKIIKNNFFKFFNNFLRIKFHENSLMFLDTKKKSLKISNFFKKKVDTLYYFNLAFFRQHVWDQLWKDEFKRMIDNDVSPTLGRGRLLKTCQWVEIQVQIQESWSRWKETDILIILVFPYLPIN